MSETTILDRKLLDSFRVKPGSRLRLVDRDPSWAGTDEMRALGEDELKRQAQAWVQDSLQKLSAEQERLWAQDQYAILVVLQAMDAAGKDGMIKHVMSGLNPQGCSVHSFKRPSEEELDHDFLWRCGLKLPRRGEIGIFNRSYYEEVLVVRVHRAILEKQKLPPQSWLTPSSSKSPPASTWRSDPLGEKRSE